LLYEGDLLTMFIDYQQTYPQQLWKRKISG
jgi:hypothetical protein